MSSSDENVALVRLVLATEDMEAMVTFYERLLGAPMRAYKAYGTTLYSTAGSPSLTLCPNAVAGVEAKQSRHQLSWQFKDLTAPIARLGGTGRIESTKKDDSGPLELVMRDPDGNSLVLVRAGL